MITAEQLIHATRSFLGVPFRHQGRSVEGLDCAGLLVLAHRVCGLVAPDLAGYARIPDGRSLKALIETSDVIAKSTLYTPGAIVLFRFRNEPQHVGLSTGETLIHSYSQVGKVVEHNWDKLWLTRVVGSYKHKEVN